MPSGDLPPQRGVPRPLSGGPSPSSGPSGSMRGLLWGGTAEIYVVNAHRSTRATEPKKLVSSSALCLPHCRFGPRGPDDVRARGGPARGGAERERRQGTLGFGGSMAREPWLAMELRRAGAISTACCARLVMEGRKLPPGHRQRARCAGGAPVALAERPRRASDTTGQPLGIIHRDVTPSNVYLSGLGQVKLGDFGIARSATRATMRSGSAAMLKGKFAYLSPEQIAGDPFDHRADLFAVAVVLSEMLLGQPLFSGSGQLAILLAIRDCRIDPLRNARDTLPKGLYEVLVRALSRDPNVRLPTAEPILVGALAAFRSDAVRRGARAELGALVRCSPDGALERTRCRRCAELDAKPGRQSHRRSTSTWRWRASRRLPRRTTSLNTHRFRRYVLTQNGEKLGPWAFARLVEAVSTGEVTRGDMVDYLGRGLAPIESLRGARRASCRRPHGDDQPPGPRGPARLRRRGVSWTALVTVLLRVVESDATGVLFADETADRVAAGRGPTPDGHAQGEGKPQGALLRRRTPNSITWLVLNNASELLGEFLVAPRSDHARRALTSPSAVLPRYGGSMGDTLISAWYWSPRSTSSARSARKAATGLIDLFQWPTGTSHLLRRSDRAARGVSRSISTSCPPLLLAGMEAAATPGDDAGRQDGALAREGDHRSAPPRPAAASRSSATPPGPPASSACSRRRPSPGRSVTSSAWSASGREALPPAIDLLPALAARRLAVTTNVVPDRRWNRETGRREGLRIA